MLNHEFIEDHRELCVEVAPYHMISHTICDIFPFHVICFIILDLLWALT